jgi:glycyl-tRNA synthetase
MVGIDCSIIMHPQVWKCSGHYDLFVDKMVDCTESKKRYRFDHVRGRWLFFVPGDFGLHDLKLSDEQKNFFSENQHVFIATNAEGKEAGLEDTVNRACQILGIRSKNSGKLRWESEDEIVGLSRDDELRLVIGPDATKPGTFTEPRDFNLMFKTTVGALGDAERDAAFLRPETAQGIFVNFKNVTDSTRVKIPFGIAQVGKSFRNEITPRNFTFRSREFEQMEIEFFCHPATSRKWYEYWRDRRMAWYTGLGLSGERLQLREHGQDELSHYSCGTADIEYAFPFLAAGEYGELEGIAHRGDFDLRSHMEGKLAKNAQGCLELETVDVEGGKKVPRHKGSGRDLTYRDDVTNERFTPHVIEPSAGADRATLAFLCEAYCEDQAPDEKGDMQTRTVMRFHPRIAPVKAAVFPLVKKDGMPEAAAEIYTALKKRFVVFYDEKGAVGRRYRRQDEAGTPFCITVDGQTLTDGTVTIRDRDTLKQWRVKIADVVDEIARRVEG